MPMWLVNSYVEMMPRLQAEESLLSVARTAIGSGTMEKNASARIQRQWSKDAQSPREKRSVTPEQFKMQMNLAGIPVIME